VKSTGAPKWGELVVNAMIMAVSAGQVANLAALLACANPATDVVSAT
jgi:hypothetical protein